VNLWSQTRGPTGNGPGMAEREPAVDALREPEQAQATTCDFRVAKLTGEHQLAWEYGLTQQQNRVF